MQFSTVVDAATDSISQGQNITHSESIVSAGDPSLGTEELKMDPKQPNEYFIRTGSQILWRSGVWNGEVFTMIPEMRPNSKINFSHHSDENETYFTYSVKDSTISRLLLDMSGQIKQSNCEQITETFCQCLQGFRPSDSLKRLNQSSGCVRRIPLQCEDNSDNGDEDRFLRMNNVKIPYGAKESKVQAAEECKLACFNDCACTAYAYNEKAVCSLWHVEMLNLIQLSKDHPNGHTLYLKLAASEFQIPRGNLISLNLSVSEKNEYYFTVSASGLTFFDNIFLDVGEKKLIWVIALVVALAVLLPASYIIYRWRRKLKEKGNLLMPILLFGVCTCVCCVYVCVFI
ncbi:hypothetical protein LWI29_024825 [Acer saccharum]|uniref:Apple domain-containing protein n=1 Tax=Acer saccharum TaxID=4024 RepID=A0AA39W2A7_ACESA|nr:hypothetical protein LWI29_024825 [Acer saccharum]